MQASPASLKADEGGREREKKGKAIWDLVLFVMPVSKKHFINN